MRNIEVLAGKAVVVVVVVESKGVEMGGRLMGMAVDDDGRAGVGGGGGGDVVEGGGGTGGRLKRGFEGSKAVVFCVGGCGA